MQTGAIPGRSLTLVASLLVTLLSGCASTRPPEVHPRVSAEQLLEGGHLGGEHVEHIGPLGLLETTPEMQRFVAQNVPDYLPESRKITVLLSAMLDEGLGLSYDNFHTLTARELYLRRSGNCLSFTALFIALARETGLDVDFQEVDVPPTWSMNGQTWVYNQHVNAVVKVNGGEQVVDFDMANFDSRYHRRRISEREALALYFSNKGVDATIEGDYHRAFANLRKALQLSPAGHIWTNLGVLYRRTGDSELAKQSYLRAIEVDANLTAMSNLAHLYGLEGEAEKSEKYASLAESYRRKNPFYLYSLADTAYREGGYDAAEEYLLQAIRSNGRVHEFHRLLGFTYMQRGEIEEAETHFRLARELTDSADERQNYNRKLKLLTAEH